ncbi:MAG: serine hydrolase [Deltaproteobacteria bacterium]|nr:serine hydrolase [Deltaproteobacteria bacterium]MBI5905924.1 serine hydrolase [Deltaproteobacteria bacterium]
MARLAVLGAVAVAWLGLTDGDGARCGDLEKALDVAMEGAMSGGLLAGGVVSVGSREGILITKAYGRRWGGASAESLNTGAVFDLASLTKVVATAPSVMKLAAEGRLVLNDPLGKWFPEVKGTGAQRVEVRDLLTHTSGLRDFRIAGERPLDAALRGVARQGAGGLVRGQFRYADINFILLGELVRRVSGVPLNQYAKESFYGPLRMTDTGFLPGPELWTRCVPTAGGSGQVAVGRVQDPVARQFGGVAGHAGLFGTIGDLGRFARMLLGLGELEGTRVLTESTVRLMIAPRPFGGGTVRSLGWDVSSAYSSPRIDAFTADSFGHTGYTGVSIWLDPGLDTFVILLGSRLEYRRTRAFNQLRADISSAVASDMAARRVPSGAAQPGG